MWGAIQMKISAGGCVLLAYIIAGSSNGYCQTPTYASGVIPDDSRLKIIYDGDMQAVVKVVTGSSDVRVGPFRARIPNSRDQPVSAGYHLEVTYDGETVSGSERQTSATRGASGSGSFRGTRSGDQCAIVTAEGHRYTARCTIDLFEYQDNYADPRGQNVKSHYTARRTGKVIDLVEQERQQAAARAEAEKKAAAQRAEDQLLLADTKAKALRGDALAMFRLGDAYHEGKLGLQRDFNLAMSWYERGTSLGFAMAAWRIEKMYNEGEGVKPSGSRVFQYRMACANAKPEGAFKFGLYQDMRKIYEDIRTTCMRFTGEALYEGNGVVRNEQQALIYFRRCAERGEDDCIKWMNEHGAN